MSDIALKKNNIYIAFGISIEVVYRQRCPVVTWLVPRETAAVSARSVQYTIQSCTMSRHFMQSRKSRGGDVTGDVQVQTMLRLDHRADRK